MIEDIKKLISLVDPLQLMNYLCFNAMTCTLNKLSEEDFSFEEICRLRCVEYVQSVIVSMKHDKSLEYSRDKQEKVFYEIMIRCQELYQSLMSYYTYLSAKNRQAGKASDDEDAMMYAQFMYLVRGTQYQNFRIPILQELLKPYEEILNELYGLTLPCVVNGLEKMEKNLSSGRIDVMKDIYRFYEKHVANGLGELPEGDRERFSKMLLDAFDVSLYDVKATSGWPVEFINEFCLDIGSDTSFFLHDKYPGWPIWNLPVKYKPFVRIDGVAYCFDYYTFFDNFFVALQKVIRSHGKIYKDRWDRIQGHAVEKIVGGVFEKILPGSLIHYSNHYMADDGKRTENDILIEYKDTLLIVEVKSGSFIYTPAIIEFDAYKNSLANLVGMAEKQCMSVYNYIISGEDKISFYSDDNLKTFAFSISKDNYNQIYMFDVTLSDFNYFAASMEQFKIADVKRGIITLSLNDLWVYKEYFDNPLQFIHYIKQRTISTEVDEIMPSDELDHLGMYITHNTYSQVGIPYGQALTPNVLGYRKEIDDYLSRKHMGQEASKPVQNIPKKLEEIIDLLIQKDKYVTRFCNFLLDMPQDIKNLFVNSLLSNARKALELGRMLLTISTGSMPYALITDVPGVQKLSRDEIEKQALSSMAYNDMQECWIIMAIMDRSYNILDIDYELLSIENIPEGKRNLYKAIGKQKEKDKENLIAPPIIKKKIYPNDMCLCGSGKKYKHCCGKR